MSRLLVCDGCQKQVNPCEIVDTDVPWFDVIAKSPDMHDPSFCSLTCMADWAIAKSAEEVTQA